MRPRTAVVRVAGPADPETVWRRYTQPQLWPTWSPQIRSVEYGHSLLRPGTGGVVRTVGGIGIPFTVAEVDAASRTWAWQVRLRGGLSLSLNHGVEPADGPGTSTWLEVTGPPMVTPVYARIAAISALPRLVRARPSAGSQPGPR